MMVLGSKLLSENIHLRKLKFKYAKIAVIKKIFGQNLSLSLIVHDSSIPLTNGEIAPWSDMCVKECRCDVSQKQKWF